MKFYTAHCHPNDSGLAIFGAQMIGLFQFIPFGYRRQSWFAAVVTQAGLKYINNLSVKNLTSSNPIMRRSRAPTPSLQI
jgi:hypothetical protein